MTSTAESEHYLELKALSLADLRQRARDAGLRPARGTDPTAIIDQLLEV